MEAACHPAFRLNGQHFTYTDLSEVAYSLVKEGAPFEQPAGGFLMDWMDGGHTIPQFTSGSTGPPKLISIAKSAMVASARETGSFFNLGPGSRALCCLPATTIAGKMMLVRAMVLGWDLEMAKPEANPLKAVRGSFDFTAMVPLQVSGAREELHRCRHVLVGGAAIPPLVLSGLPVSGTEFWQSYGMTETASHVALRKLVPVKQGKDPEEILPPYCPLDGIEFGLGKDGCLVIRALTRSPYPIHTRDLAEILPGGCFRWVGRADNIVNSGGVKLSPERLEVRLGDLLELPYFLSGLPDNRLGEHLALLIEGSCDTVRLLEKIRASDRFSDYELPRSVHCMDAFARTPNGKLDRSATRSRLLV